MQTTKLLLTLLCMSTPALADDLSDLMAEFTGQPAKESPAAPVAPATPAATDKYAYRLATLRGASLQPGSLQVGGGLRGGNLQPAAALQPSGERGAAPAPGVATRFGMGDEEWRRLFPRKMGN